MLRALSGKVTEHTPNALASDDLDKDEILHHLIADHLWKVGIVAVAAVVVLTAMVIIYKKVGAK